KSGAAEQPAARPEQSATLPKSRRWPRLLTWLLPILLVAVVAAAFLVRRMLESPPPPPSLTESPIPDPEFVGAAQCAACHEHENNLWNGSHHQLAMQPATDSTVLGDFN